MTATPIELTSQNFATEVVNSDVPVLVDFWAPWCGPCRVIGPIIKNLAAEYDGVLKVSKLNVDDASDIASQYQITAIPSLLVFRNGEVVDRFQGVVPQNAIVDRLAALGINPTVTA